MTIKIGSKEHATYLRSAIEDSIKHVPHDEDAPYRALYDKIHGSYHIVNTGTKKIKALSAAHSGGLAMSTADYHNREHKNQKQYDESKEHDIETILSETTFYPPLIDTLIDENYVDLKANIHEVIKSKAMDIIDRIRVEVAENFIDGKKKDDDSDDKDDDDKSEKKDKDSDSEDKDNDDDKKEKSEKKDDDDDSKENGKKDKKFPFFMKK